MIFSRLALVLCLLVPFLFSSAQAQSRLDLLIDLDNNPATGCSVSTEDGVFPGVEWVLETSVSAGAVSDVSRSVCVDAAGSGFLAPESVSAGGWPVGVGNGDNGSDVIETQVSLPDDAFRNLRIALVSSGGRGDDALNNASGATGNSSGMALASGAIGIPTLSTIGIGVLLLLVAVIVMARLRRMNQPTTVMLSVALILAGAGLAWAATLDGNTDDWSASQRLGQDALADGEPDIVSLYGQVMGSNTLVFRIDAFLQTPPAASNDNYITAEDTALNVATPGVLANDTAPFGGALTATLVGDVSNGTLTLNADGSFDYTPNTDFAGSDSFSYTANDGTLDSATATVTITVGAANDAPVFTSTAVNSATQDSAYSYAVTATDADGDTLTLTAPTLPNWLSFTDNGSGAGLLVGTPALADVGDHPVVLQVNDGTTSVYQSFTITVTALNAAPVAVTDAFSMDEDSLLSIAVPGVLANDTDADSDPLTATLVTGPANASSFTLNADGSFDYTPNTDFNGSDSFSYLANDGTVDSNTVTVTITVNAVNDAPEFTSVALTGAVQDTAYSYAITTNDVDGDTLTITAPTLPSWLSFTDNGNGTASLTGTPGQPETGSHPVSLVVNDGTVSVNQDFTIVVSDTNETPVPSGDAIDVDEGGTATQTSTAQASLLANDSDPDGNNLILTNVTSLPVNGSITANADGTFSYIHDGSETTSDSFTYEVCDDVSPPLCATAVVSIVVTPVNDPPVATDASFSVDENSANSTVVGTIAASDADMPAQTLSYAITAGNAGGAFAIDGSGQITVANSSALDFETTPAFALTVTVTDSGTPNLSDTAAISISLNDVNEAPVANADTIDVVEGGTQTVANGGANASLLANDSDPDSNGLILTNVTSLPVNGAVTANADGTFSYTHDGSETTSDSFTYELCDDVSPPLCSSAVVSISITPVDDPAVANDDAASVTEDDPATAISVLGNDVDPDGPALAIQSVMQPSNGTVVITGGGSGLTYQPSADYCNDGAPTDDFSYTLVGGGTATVAMTVACVNDAPTAADDSIATVGNVPVISGATAPSYAHFSFGTGALSNDSDPVEGNSLSVSAVNGSAANVGVATATTQGGSVTMAANGSYIYTPPLGQISLTDSFTYTVTDSPASGTPQSATATVTISVGAERVWFIDNSATAGGNGSAASPFASIAEYETARSGGSVQTGDTLFVLAGNTAVTPLDGSIVLLDDMSLFGEGVGLFLDDPNDTDPSLVELVAAGTTPRITHTSIGNVVTAANNTTVAGIAIVGGLNDGIGVAGVTGVVLRDLSIDGVSGDAVGPVSLPGSGFGVALDGVTVTSVTRGVQVDQFDTVASVLSVTDSSFSTIADAIDVRPSSGSVSVDLGGLVTVSSSTANGVNLSGLGGEVFVTGLADLTALNVAGTGFLADTVVFDANPGDADFTGDIVSAGTLTIGTMGAPVADGVFLDTVSGDLSLTALNAYSTGGAVRVFGNGVFDAGAGVGMQLQVADGSLVAQAGGVGLSLDTIAAPSGVTFSSIDATGSIYGVAVSDMAGTVNVNGGTLTDNPFAAVFVSGSSGTINIAASITQGSAGGAVALATLGGANITFTAPITATSGSGIGIANSTGSNTINFNFPVDIGTTSNRINGATALSMSGNSVGTSVTFAEFDAATENQQAISASGGGSLTITTSSYVDALNRAALNIDGVAADLNLSSVVSSNSTGTGISFANVPAAGALDITNLSVSGSANQGVSLSGNAAAVGISGGFVSNSTGNAFDVNGGAAAVSYGGTITNAGARLVNVINRTGGSVTFTGNLATTGGTGLLIDNNTSGAPSVAFNGNVTLTDTTDTAARITNSAAATVSFANLGISTLGTSQAGLLANNAGTLNITTGTINTTTGVAVDIINTALGVTLQSVGVNGAANGIDLDTTTGSFTVTGVGTTANSGGIITNTTGDGVLLNSVSNVSLSNMTISNTDGDGIGSPAMPTGSIAGLSLTGVAFSNNGDSAVDDEGGINISNLTGTSVWDSISVTGAFEYGARIVNTAGTMNSLTVRDSTFADNDVSNGLEGFLLDAQSSASSTLVINNTSFAGHRAAHAGIFASGTAVVNSTITGSTFSNDTNYNTPTAINMEVAGDADLNFSIDGNSFAGPGTTSSRAIDLRLASNTLFTASLVGSIANNTSFDAWNNGVYTLVDGAGVFTATLDNNTMTNILNAGIRGAVPVGSGTIAQANVTITNNNIALSNSGFPVAALQWQSGEGVNTCLNVRDNSLNAGTTGFADTARHRNLNQPSSTLLLESGPTDCGGAACGNAADHLSNQNTEINGTSDTSNVSLTAPGTCPTVP